MICSEREFKSKLKQIYAGILNFQLKGLDIYVESNGNLREEFELVRHLSSTLYSSWKLTDT